MAIFQRGETFAKHEIGQLLGEGRLAEVYEATGADGARRAMKVLKVDVELGAKAQARLAQECEVVATIEHTHVVRYHGAGIDAGRAWLLTERVHGPNLRQLVREAGGLLPVERAVSIVQQAAEGVAAAHRLGIVHRDLKPENVLVGPDDLVKVADFGSANVGEWGVRTTTSERDLASCLYAAPEWLSRKKTLPEGDVYVLGVLLYELVSGIHPIVTGPLTPIAIVRNHLLFNPPPLATRSTPERVIPGDLSALCERAMAKDPARRGSMRELADGLAQVLTRLRAPRRAEARNLPLPDRSAALAKTEPALAASGPYGTAIMPAVGEAPAAAHAPTLLPTAPAAPAPSAPAPTPAGAPPRLRLVPTLIALEAPGDRRSTAAPVERPAPLPARAATRGPRWALAAAAAALALGLGSAGWWLSSQGFATAARAPPPEAPPPLSASVPAPPPAVASAPAPSAPVDAGAPRSRPWAAPPTPARPRAPPPAPRPALPFP